MSKHNNWYGELRKDNALTKDEVLSIWYHHYILNGNKDYDKHGFFARDIAEDRHIAKKVCYMLAFRVHSSKLLQGFNEGE